jgi:hypothetical protein
MIFMHQPSASEKHAKEALAAECALLRAAMVAAETEELARRLGGEYVDCVLEWLECGRGGVITMR